MRRAYSVLALLFVVACASTSNAPARTPLDTAKLSYVDASLAYEAGMLSVQDLRRDHLVTDAQWTRVDKAQKVVQQYTPLVRAGLNLWESSGSKPTSIDDALAKILAAAAEITRVLSEVKR